MMNNDVRYCAKYKPLFRKARTRYKIVTGGRGSGKSFAISSALVCDTYNDDFNTLFTRYTMVAAHDSIIPEFVDKVSLLQLDNDFHITRQDVLNKASGGGILFRGLMVSSKNQVARLKSIAKVKRLIIDEAQELTDEELFDTIDFSIRTTEVDNEIWLIWNPPRDKNHWIYRRFFKDAGVDITHNGVVGDVEYIYTTYLDNLANLDATFIAQAHKMEERDRDKYLNVFLGIPVGYKEGQIYRWTAQAESEWEATRQTLCYGVDWGYSNDQTAVVRVDYDYDTRTVYLKEVMYAKEMQPRDVAKAIREDMERIHCGDVLVYCDPARPEHIAELRRYAINAAKAVNKNKAGRINYLQGFTVFYDGEDIGHEADNYSFKPHPQDRTQFTNEPEDGNDHCFVADTIITTRDGGKRIADIVIGDEVLTSEGWRKVLKVWDNGEKEVLLMSLNFGKFKVLTEATPDHLFKTDKGWKQLQLLQKTDRLFLHAGSRLKQTSTANSNIAVCLAVQSIDVLSQRKARVYDLTVEGCHEFFANGVLVHNCMDAANYGAVTHLRKLGIVNDDDVR